MELWSWLTGDETETSELPSPSTLHDPPGFLSIRKTKPTEWELSGNGAAGGTLTPLEAQLKSIVVDVYSDKKTNTSLFTGRKRKTSNGNSHTGESVQSERGGFHSLPSTPVLSNFSKHTRHSLQLEEGSFRPRPEGSESPRAFVSNNNRTKPDSDCIHLVSPEDLSAGVNVLVKALQQRELTRASSSTTYSSHRNLKDSISGTELKQESVSMATRPQIDQGVSDSHSVGSLPAFSADDLELDSDEAASLPLQPVNRMQYIEALVGQNADTRQTKKSESLPLLADSLLYSFSDSSTNSASRKELKPPALTDSFGISPQLYQTALSKPKVLQSPRSHSSSDQVDRRISPIGSSQMTPDLLTSPQAASQMAPPLPSNQVTPSHANQVTPPLAPNQVTPPTAPNEVTPPLVPNQGTPPLAANQISLSSLTPKRATTLSTPTSPRLMDKPSTDSNGDVSHINSAAESLKVSNYASPDSIHSQADIPVNNTDNGGCTNPVGGVAGDKTGTVYGESINDKPPESVSAVLPVEEHGADNASREVTPTPESTPAQKSFVSQTSALESNSGIGRQPSVEGLVLKQGNVGAGYGSDCVSDDQGSEVTDSNEEQLLQEDRVQYPGGLDSDAVETGSVVSVQQLAEDYLSVELSDLDNVTVPAGGEGGAPLRLPAAAASSPKVTRPAVKELHSPVVKEGQSFSPSKVPPHISTHQPVEKKKSDHLPPSYIPAVSSNHSGSISSLPKGRPEVNGIGEPSDRERDLEELLAEEKRVRMRLQGQLESLSEEYEMAVGDRSDLLNKLGRTKATLDEVTEALQREKEDNMKLRAQVTEEHPQTVATAPAPFQGSEELVKEKEANRNLQSSLAKEKQKSIQLEKKVEDTKQALEQAESTLEELQERVRCAQAEVQRKADESEERLCKLSALEASYGALEKNKQWLHEQLQEGLEGKLKLQEEVREAKASSIAQAIKTDQVLQENALLQQQVSELQKGVLLDKEKLISQLEEIEAGVLSREDLCSTLVAEKSQLEDMIKLKEEMVSKLNADLGRAQVEKGELQEQVDQLSRGKAELARRTSDLEKEGKNLSKKVKDLANSLESKKNECAELENAKSSLQERLRQSDMECVSREGIIQTLNEAKDMLQRELDLVNESKEGVEKELEDTKCDVVKLEAEIRAALEKCSEKDRLLQNAVEAVDGEDQKEAMQALLSAKEGELRDKETAIKSLEEQVGELVKEFATLQSDVHAQSGPVADSIAEKDRVIAHLSALKDQSEQELESLKEENDRFHERVTQLQHEKARLQGQVEGSVQPGDYQKSLQDKAELQAFLNAEKLQHQQDQLNSQAKVNRLEKELRESQRAVSNMQNDLRKAQDNFKEEIDRVKDEGARLVAKLKEAEDRLRRTQVDRELPRANQDTSRHSGDYVSALRAKCDDLRKENQALAHSLEEEVEQRREVERASGLVAAQLKQKFEKEKKELLEKNGEQTFDLERLQGKLLGLQTTQATLREHTSRLQESLAGKEAEVVRLNGRLHRLTEEKEVDWHESKTRITALEGQLKVKEEEMAECREEIQDRKKKVEELEEEVGRLEADVATNKAELSRLNVGDTQRLKEKVTSLSLENETLQSDLSYHKSQLLIAKTSADSAKREITDKVSQIEILERQLAIAESRYQQTNDDLKKLKEHMRSSERLQAAGYLDGLKGGREAGAAGDVGARQWRRRKDRGSGSDHPLDSSLSSISGTDEADQSSLNQSGNKSDLGQVNVEKPEMMAHRSSGARVEQARLAADLGHHKDMSPLQEKPRTIGSLQAYINDLRSDMRKLNLQVHQNSAIVRESQKSSRQADSQIEELRRSSSFPYSQQSSTEQPS